MVEILSPILQRLYSDWDNWRGSRPFPTRQDFDPEDINYIIGRVNLVDVYYNPLRFRYRVFGTTLAQRLGIEMTGRFVDEYPAGEQREHVQRRYAQTIIVRQPTVVLHKRFSLDGWGHSYESIVLPLSTDGASIDMMLAGFAFRDPNSP
jgi:hypothetical protein